VLSRTAVLSIHPKASFSFTLPSIVLTVDLPASAYLVVLLENQNWVQKLDSRPMVLLADTLVTVS
jgi:hypothetical protein